MRNKIQYEAKSIHLVAIALLFAISQFSWLRCTAAQQNARSEPKHLTAARAMLEHLDLSNTDYQLGGGTVTFTAPCISRTDCSGFADALLIYSYGYDADQFRKWFGSSRPSARRYHDAIEQEKGFHRIEHMQDVLPGDFLAVKYFNRKDDTGHIMLVAAKPQRIEPLAPLEPGTVQWRVDVIDSSKSGHGPTDTRYKKGTDGKDHPGLGEGIFRVYTDRQGTVSGFAWSTLSASKYIEPKDENLVIGRLKLESEK